MRNTFDHANTTLEVMEPLAHERAARIGMTVTLDKSSDLHCYRLFKDGKEIPRLLFSIDELSAFVKGFEFACRV